MVGSQDEKTVKSFAEGDIVTHIFHGRTGVVTKVGRKYVYVRLTIGPKAPYRFLPTSLRHVGVR